MEANRLKNGAEPSARDCPAGTTIRTLPCRPPPAHQKPSPNGNSGGPTRRSRSVAAQAEPQPDNPCWRNRDADRQQPLQHGSTYGKVRRAPGKIVRRCTFPRCSRQARARNGGRLRMRRRRKTWCVRRTLPHVQSFLLIFHAFKHGPAVVCRGEKSFAPACDQGWSIFDGHCGHPGGDSLIVTTHHRETDHFVDRFRQVAAQARNPCSSVHRHVNATARRDDLLGCGVEEAIHKPLHLVEVMIHGDQFRADFNGLGRDPDVIGWDGGALFPKLGGNSGVPVR